MISLRRYYHRRFGHHERFHLAVILTIVVVAYVAVPRVVRYVDALQGYAPPAHYRRGPGGGRDPRRAQRAAPARHPSPRRAPRSRRLRCPARRARQALRVPDRYGPGGRPAPAAVRVARAGRARPPGDATGARAPGRPPRLRRLLRRAGAAEGPDVPRPSGARRRSPR